MNGDDSAHRTLPGGEVFFGRIVAGTSHELTNVLNIVGELAGLQDDILRDATAGEVLDPGRLAELADRIRHQTARGQAMLRQLNRFAHSVDHTAESYDVGDMLESLVALGDRFARLARARLELRPPLETVSLVGDPFAMLVAVFACLDHLLHGTADDRHIRLIVDASPGGARLTLHSADAVPPASTETVATVERALASCPGRLLEMPSETAPHRFALELYDARAPDVGSREDTHAP